MDLTAMHKRVIALDVHQVRITAYTVVEHDHTRVECRANVHPGAPVSLKELGDQQSAVASAGCLARTLGRP